MFRTCINAISHTPLTNSTRFNVVSRHHGKFRAVNWDPKFKGDNSEHSRDDMGLSKHQVTHTNVQDSRTNNIVGIFTSSSGKTANPTVHFEKIDTVLFDGSFTPQKDPQTKQPIVDAQGQHVPDPQKGGQKVAISPNQYKVNEDAKHHLKVDLTLQSYVDKHESKIEHAIENAKKKSTCKLTKNIGGKDDE